MCSVGRLSDTAVTDFLLHHAMLDETKKEDAVLRVRQRLTALAAFARVREELILKRLTTVQGEQIALLEESLRLNKDMMEETRKALWRAEDDLLKEIGDAG